MGDTSKEANFLYKKGERVGRYEVINTLDQTKFADRYQGQQVPHGIPVIIEVLRPTLANGLKQNFLSQAQTLMKLHHPNILRLRDAGVRDNYPFLVTDYASYLTLRRVYLEGSMQPLAGLMPHLKQIASALQYAHNQQVLHGDIQPANILLDGNNNVLLWGFTFEAIKQNRERLNFQIAGVMPGAIAYTAPEQIRGKAEAASDQYSLAILVYELLCGALPFTGSSLEVANQQLHTPPPALKQRAPGIASGVEKAVMKALEKDPRQRFSDIQTFITILEQEQHRQVGAVIAQKQPAPAQPARAVAPTVLPQAAIPPAAPAALAAPMPVRAFPAVPLSTPTVWSPVSPQTPADPAPVKDSPPAPRLRDSTTMTRRAFAIGLVGLAAGGGAGGWYLLQKRLALPAPLAVGPDATPPAKQTIVNNTKVLIFSGHLASVNALAWSPDGKLIASASDDTYVQVFDATNGQRKFIYSGHTEEVAAVAWSPNSKFIASGGQDTTVQVWNANNGARIFTYREHTDRVNGVSWSNDSQLIASGSEDKTVKVWNAANGSVELQLPRAYGGSALRGWQPDKSSVASGSWDGTLRDWATVKHGDHFNAGDQIFKYSGHGEQRSQRAGMVAQWRLHCLCRSRPDRSDLEWR